MTPFEDPVWKRAAAMAIFFSLISLVAVYGGLV